VRPFVDIATLHLNQVHHHSTHHSCWPLPHASYSRIAITITATTIASIDIAAKLKHLSFRTYEKVEFII
jgi:hypothetical protein